MKKYQKQLLSLLAGAVLGYLLYYHFFMDVILLIAHEGFLYMIINIAMLLLSIVGCAAIIYLGYQYVQNQFTNNVLSMGMSWPVWLYGIWLPIGGAVLCIRQIQLAVKTFIATLHHGKEETA